MLLRQRLFRSAPGLAFLVVNLFLALSLYGYDPGDSLRGGSATEYAAATPIANPCGPVGARLAEIAQRSFGWASWLGLVALTALNLLVARDRRPADRFGPAIGFLLVITVAAALVDRFGAWMRPSAPVGPGGYAGALTVCALEGQFGLAGMLLILGAAGILGAALCQEVLVTHPVQELSAMLPGLFRRRRAAGPIGGVPALAEWQPAAALPGEVAPRSALARVAEVAPRPGPLVQRGPAAGAGTPPPLVRAPQPPAVARPSQPVPMVDPSSPFQLPPYELLEPPSPAPVQEHEAQIHARAMLLERTLLDFGYQVRVVQIDTGPVITQFEIELEAGLRVSRIAGLSDDLAIALAVPTVRIVAPIPGKSTVGIEVPNERRTMVRISEVIADTEAARAKCRIPLFLGKDVKGTPMVFDMADMPHLLIAGRTGTGKSVCLNAMITSILMTRSPDEVKMIMIDPKMVELSLFKKIPHLMTPVVTDMNKAESILSWACDKMDERYGYMARAGVRHISLYNQLGADEIMRRIDGDQIKSAVLI